MKTLRDLVIYFENFKKLTSGKYFKEIWIVEDKKTTTLYSKKRNPVLFIESTIELI